MVMRRPTTRSTRPYSRPTCRLFRGWKYFFRGLKVPFQLWIVALREPLVDTLLSLPVRSPIEPFLSDWYFLPMLALS